MKNEKNYRGFLIHEILQIFSVSLEHFVESKPLISEEWYHNGSHIEPLKIIPLLSDEDQGGCKRFLNRVLEKSMANDKFDLCGADPTP